MICLINHNALLAEQFQIIMVQEEEVAAGRDGDVDLAGKPEGGKESFKEVVRRPRSSLRVPCNPSIFLDSILV